MNTRLRGLLLIILVAVVMASADDVKKSMIAVIPVQTGDKDVNLMPPSELRACDWVAAWQAAREACPDAQETRIYFKDRPGTSIKAPGLFECMDIKARGQVLLITVRKTDKTEESVILVPASEVLRLEIVKKPAS
ncbi:MAG: hypothetical protein KKD33_08130 [Verrucomicrobia bacterium]|nr:hypothetical protein [Verrucomicrobiota bacterium]